MKILSGMFIGLILISFSSVAIASEKLQTEITKEDLRIIDKLVQIAQKNSHEVRKAKYETGLNAFTDSISIELSPSQSFTNYKKPEFFFEDVRSFSISLNIDLIQIITAIDKMPVIKARLRETKKQTRLKVVKQYFAYLQSRQASKIAAHRMQKFQKRERIASNIYFGSSQQLDNDNYVAVATDNLNKNMEERLALEELAQIVGLSAQEMRNILNK